MKGLVAVLLILAVAHSVVVGRGHAAVTCSDLETAVTPCHAYGNGAEPRPSALCCSGLRSAVSMLRSTEDRRSSCRCLVAKVSAGSDDDLSDAVEKINYASHKCDIPLPYPVNEDLDCNSIQ